MKNLLLLFVISLFILSCESGEQANSSKNLKPVADSLLKEVMNIHDEIMPQTLVLEKLKKKIASRLDSVEIDSVTGLAYENTFNSIDTAIIGMRNWMYNFERPADSISMEDVVKYYQSQIDIMEKVKQQTFEILPQAEAKLSELDSL